MMHWTSRTYYSWKDGNCQAEYEDAVAISARAGRYAVADGATESSFSGHWAALLVNAYVTGKFRANTLQEDLVPLQAKWLQSIAAKPQPWYVAEKLRTGAFAAFVGLTLTRDGFWSAYAVGDCCLFLVEGSGTIRSFPIGAAEDFTNRPFLIGSNPIYSGKLAHSLVQQHGIYAVGDTFLLMSDALAAATLHLSTNGRFPPELLDFRLVRGGFRAWVTRLRADHVLRNDDVSLVRVEVR